MTDQSNETNHENHDRDEAAQRVAETHAPSGEPVPIDADNRSDANDGVDRPLGYFSSQAQADRNADRPGDTEVDAVAGGPGFYSPEQQAARNGPSDEETAHSPTEDAKAVVNPAGPDSRPTAADAGQQTRPDTLRRPS